MSLPVVDRTASTPVALLDVLADRWSPRAFENAEPIDEQKLIAALEAARWSPSAFNRQPWRFIVARRGGTLHARLVETLSGFNASWAPNAAALIVALAEVAEEDGTLLPYAHYDLGQAVAHLSIQAHADGLVVHQMAGFDHEAARAALDVDERFVPVTIVALGEIGDPGSLTGVLLERETAPRQRRSIDETVLLDD